MSSQLNSPSRKARILVIRGSAEWKCPSKASYVKERPAMSHDHLGGRKQVASAWVGTGHNIHKSATSNCSSRETPQEVSCQLNACHITSISTCQNLGINTPGPSRIYKSDNGIILLETHLPTGNRKLDSTLHLRCSQSTLTSPHTTYSKPIYQPATIPLDSTLHLWCSQ